MYVYLQYNPDVFFSYVSPNEGPRCLHTVYSFRLGSLKQVLLHEMSVGLLRNNGQSLHLL